MLSTLPTTHADLKVRVLGTKCSYAPDTHMQDKGGY